MHKNQFFFGMFLFHWIRPFCQPLKNSSAHADHINWSKTKPSTSLIIWSITKRSCLITRINSVDSEQLWITVDIDNKLHKLDSSKVSITLVVHRRIMQCQLGCKVVNTNSNKCKIYNQFENMCAAVQQFPKMVQKILATFTVCHKKFESIT